MCSLGLLEEKFVEFQQTVSLPDQKRQDLRRISLFSIVYGVPVRYAVNCVNYTKSSIIVL